MMRSFFTGLLLVGAALAIPSIAAAQSSSHGTIVGTVLDQTGMPIKGVKISAKSDTNIGGPKVVYSNDEGTFRIVGLNPGKFEINASAPKMNTVIQKGIDVGLAAAAEVTLMMEVQQATEEVKVVERAPVISTTSPVVKEVYDEEFVDNLPVDFKTSAESFIGNNVPGAVSVSQRDSRIRGGGASQTHMLVEGFYMNGQRSTIKGLAAMEVLTAGYGAENASTPGGVVNMVTKSGSNKFEFDFAGFVEHNELRFFRDKADGNNVNYWYQLNPNFSGPIVKDKLWFFANLEGRIQSQGVGKDPNGVFPQNPNMLYGSLRGSVKLTWQTTARHKLISFTNFNARQETNQQRGYNPYYDPAAQKREDDRDIMQGIIWEALLADNLFLRSQVGVQQFWRVTGPQSCKWDPEECYNTFAVEQYDGRTRSTLQNYTDIDQRVRRSFQWIEKLEWFPSTRSFGEHAITLKNDFFNEAEETYEGGTGDYKEYYEGTALIRKKYWYANDPRVDDPRLGIAIRYSQGFKNVTSLSDSMKLTRYFTFNPGVAMTYARASNHTGARAYDGLAITPHVSAAWDATHDGRTVLRGSFNNYVDVNAQSLARHALGGQTVEYCHYNKDTGALNYCEYSGGTNTNTFGMPCGPTGIDEYGNDCRQKLKIPRTWEYTFGAEREVIQGVGLGADLVYRLYTYPYEVYETNRIWNNSGTALNPGGSYRNGRNETINDLSTLRDARRRYMGVTTSLKKREGALKMSVAYTWSRLEGNVLDGTGNRFGNNPAQDVFLYGYLNDDARHNVRGNLVYNWTKWLSSGLMYDYVSGRPYQREFRNDVANSFDDLRAPVGVNPGGNLNDPADDRPLRLPDIWKVNLQTRVNFKPLIGTDMEAYVDVLNLLALRTVTNVNQDDNLTWGQPSERMSPFKLRLGFRAKF